MYWNRFEFLKKINWEKISEFWHEKIFKIRKFLMDKSQKWYFSEHSIFVF